MKVACINRNGWYYWKDSYYPFLEPRHTEIEGPWINEVCFVRTMFTDSFGDLCYILEGYGNYGWCSEGFAPVIDESEIISINCDNN